MAIHILPKNNGLDLTSCYIKLNIVFQVLHLFCLENKIDHNNKVGWCNVVRCKFTVSVKSTCIQTFPVPCVYDIGHALDRGLELDIIYSDFAKDFDSVCPAKLVSKPKTFGIIARNQGHLSAVYRITLRNNRISREFNMTAITARSAKKSVSYHELYNLSTTDLLFDEKKKKRRPASKIFEIFRGRAMT